MEQSDKAKLEMLEKVNEDDRLEIAQTIVDDEIKLKALGKLRLYERLEIAKSIQDEQLKMQAVEYLSQYEKSQLIITIKNDKIKIQLLDNFQGYLKQKIAETIESDEIKLQALKKLEGPVKQKIAISITDSRIKLQALDEFEGQEKVELAKTIGDDRAKLQLLEECNLENRIVLMRTIQDSEVMFKAFDKLDGIDSNKVKLLKTLYKTNHELMQNIDFRILEDKYIKTLGEEKINLISCYPEVQAKKLDLKGKQYDLFCRCIKSYLEKSNTDEWTLIAHNLLENIQSGQYDELIESIEDINSIDIDKLTMIMQSSNEFEIKDVQGIDNFEQIKRQKCDEKITGEYSLLEKKNAVLQKIFGHDLQYAESIIERFGQDIEKIEDGDEKDFVLSLIAIMDLEDETVLRQIYDECEEIGLIDITLMERTLKNAYGKMFNKGLYETSEQDRIKEEELPEELKELGLQVYNAGLDFKMITTSVAPYNTNAPENFKKDWNRPSIISQYFCASYIRNDMQGTATIPYLCYGFTQMKEDALIQSNTGDIYSAGTTFIPAASKNISFYSPDRQINETRYFNEMDFRRIQGGEKKQPAYIIAFKRNGKVFEAGNIIKASKDWEGEVPIVLIDQDRCLQEERKKVDKMLVEYAKSKTPECAKTILQKVRNNRVTDEQFCMDIQEQLKDIEKDLKLQNEETTIKHILQKSYSKTSAQQRKEATNIMKRIRETIEELENKKEGEELG